MACMCTRCLAVDCLSTSYWIVFATPLLCTSVYQTSIRNIIILVIIRYYYVIINFKWNFHCSSACLCLLTDNFILGFSELCLTSQETEVEHIKEFTDGL